MLDKRLLHSNPHPQTTEGWDDRTEANEDRPSLALALSRLEDQIAKYETTGVLSMYEMAARDAGASWEQIYALFKKYSCKHGRYYACGACKDEEKRRKR